MFHYLKTVLNEATGSHVNKGSSLRNTYGSMNTNLILLFKLTLYTPDNGFLKVV